MASPAVEPGTRAVAQKRRQRNHHDFWVLTIREPVTAGHRPTSAVSSNQHSQIAGAKNWPKGNRLGRRRGHPRMEYRAP